MDEKKRLEAKVADQDDEIEDLTSQLEEFSEKARKSAIQVHRDPKYLFELSVLFFLCLTYDVDT